MITTHPFYNPVETVYICVPTSGLIQVPRVKNPVKDRSAKSNVTSKDINHDVDKVELPISAKNRSIKFL